MTDQEEEGGKAVISDSPSNISPKVLYHFAIYVQHSSMKEAAHVLGLSEQTIKNQISHLYDFLGIHSSHEALVALGWLQVPVGLERKEEKRKVCGWIGICSRRPSEHDHYGMIQYEGNS